MAHRRESGKSESSNSEVENSEGGSDKLYLGDDYEGNQEWELAS